MLMKTLRSSSGIRSNLAVGVGGFKFPSAESLGAAIVVTLDCTVYMQRINQCMIDLH